MTSNLCQNDHLESQQQPYPMHLLKHLKNGHLFVQLESLDARLLLTLLLIQQPDQKVGIVLLNVRFEALVHYPIGFLYQQTKEVNIKRFRNFYKDHWSCAKGGTDIW